MPYHIKPLYFCLAEKNSLLKQPIPDAVECAITGAAIAIVTVQPAKARFQNGT